MAKISNLALEKQLRAHLHEYVEGRISGDQLLERFYPDAWHIDRLQDSELSAFVHGIELLMAETSGGLKSEKELKAELSSILSIQQINESTFNLEVAGASSRVLYFAEQELPLHLIALQGIRQSAGVLMRFDHQFGDATNMYRATLQLS